MGNVYFFLISAGLTGLLYGFLRSVKLAWGNPEEEVNLAHFPKTLANRSKGCHSCFRILLLGVACWVLAAAWCGAFVYVEMVLSLDVDYSNYAWFIAIGAISINGGLFLTAAAYILADMGSRKAEKDR